jgi:hypothetical protein
MYVGTESFERTPGADPLLPVPVDPGAGGKSSTETIVNSGSAENLFWTILIADRRLHNMKSGLPHILRKARFSPWTRECLLLFVGFKKLRTFDDVFGVRSVLVHEGHYFPVSIIEFFGGFGHDKIVFHLGFP